MKPITIFVIALMFAPVSSADMSASDLSGRAAEILHAAAIAVYPNATVEVTMQPLDARLSFPTCADLSLTIQGGPVGRASALARCSGPHPWSATLPARVTVALPVVVLVRPVARGGVLSADDVKLSARELDALRGQYLTDPAFAIGNEAKRDLAPDAVLAPRHLKTPLTVRRGDRVSIVSSQGKVVVHASGIALEVGMQGEQISVRNSQSQRVIRVWVLGPGEVSTGPPV